MSRSDSHNYVLKDIPESIFDAFRTRISPQIKETPNLRLPLDNVPDHRIFAYRYLTDAFLSLIRRKISVQARKEILRSSLQGLVDLHDQNIVHLG